MPYGGSPYGGSPYGGAGDASLYQMGDLLDEGEIGGPNYEGQTSLNEFVMGDLDDEGEMGLPIYVRPYGPNASTPFPTVPPAEVEANDELFPELALEVVEHADHSHVCWLPLVITQAPSTSRWHTSTRRSPR
jgi:hypothetical protein